MRIQYNNNCLITFEGSPYLAQIRHFIPDLPTTITHKDTIFIQVQDQFEPGEATLVCQAKDFTNLESDPALSKEIYKWSAEFKKTIVHTLLKKGELGFQKDIHSKPVRTIQKIKTKRYGSTFFIWGNKKQDFYFHKEVMEFFNPQSW